MARQDNAIEAGAAPVAIDREAQQNEKEVLLSWSVSLVRKDSLLKPLVAVALIACVLALGAYLYKDALLVCFAGVVFFLATADYFYPMRFWVTREAAYRRTFYGTKFIRWSKVKRCYLEDKGIKLSPLDGPSRSEGVRGLYLYFGDNRDELVETVRNLTSAD